MQNGPGYERGQLRAVREESDEELTDSVRRDLNLDLASGSWHGLGDAIAVCGELLLGRRGNGPTITVYFCRHVGGRLDCWS
jgi:hypothetical protein